MIRMDILDKDMFDPHAETPKNTSWTMGLMSRLDGALGSDNIMDKPIFQTTVPPAPSASANASKLVAGVEAGDFDSLFPPGGDKASVIAQRVRIKPIPPFVGIVGDIVPKPLNVTLPLYPPIARVAHVEGVVKATFTISSDGTASDVKIVDGPPMLRLGVENAVKTWRFNAEQSGRVVEAALQFKLNCSASPRP